MRATHSRDCLDFKSDERGARDLKKRISISVSICLLTISQQWQRAASGWRCSLEPETLSSRRLCGAGLSSTFLPSLRQIHKTDISSIAEVKQREIFLSHLLKNDQSNVTSERIQRFHESGMSIPQLEQVVQAGLITFLLHVESRIASSLGQGFYTIGPCGEESLAAIALNIKEHDASALHYRHVSLSVL